MKTKKLIPTTDSSSSSSRQDPTVANGVTVRPRRRRRPPPSQKSEQQQSSLSSSENDDTINLQESPLSIVPSNSGNVSRTNAPNKSSDVSADETSTVTTVDMVHRHTTTTHQNKANEAFIQHFRTSVKNIKSPTSIFSHHPMLITHVITASLTLVPRTTATGPHRRTARHDRPTSTTTSLLLEEHAMELLSICRTLVKDATTDTANDDATSGGRYHDTISATATTATNDDRLFVAVHGLRALLCTQTIQSIPMDGTIPKNTSKLDTIRRLLYFCILHLPPTNKTTDNPFDRDYLIDLAYQAFGQTLHRYTFTVNHPDTNSSSLSLPERPPETMMYQCVYSPSNLIRFPIPQSSDDPSQSHDHTNTGTAATERNSTTGMDQTCIMCIVASLTVARRMVTLVQTDGGKKDLNTNNEEPIHHSTMTDGKMHKNTIIPDLVAEIRYVILDIVIPWIRTFAVLVRSSRRSKDMSTTDPTKLNQYEPMIVSYCKKGQRILYDLAETITTTTTPKTTKLSLQADSIRALLLDLDYNDPRKEHDSENQYSQQQQYQYDSIRAIFVQQNIFDQACTYAWKISDSYYNSQMTNSCSTRSSNTSNLLDTFHHQIGALLDSSMSGPLGSNISINDGDDDELSRSRTTTVPSLTSYVEYCAYRALHTTTNPTSKRGDMHHHRDCLFRSLPYLYGHSCGSKQLSDNEDEAFLLFFFLSRYTRYCLEHEADSKQLYDAFMQIPTDRIIQQFRSQYLSKTVVDSVKRLRWCNLLSFVGVHRAALRMVDRPNKSDRWITFLKVVRSVLSDGWAPFCMGLLNDVKNEKQLSQLWPCILSCHRCAIFIDEKTQAIKQSNESMAELSKILLHQMPSPSCDVIETTAKVGAFDFDCPP